MRTNREAEIIKEMTAFNKEAYAKNELLSEMFKLQEEVVKITFNEEHATTAELRLWDVERHLTDLNEQREHVADAELEKFKRESRTLCNLIKAEISGQRGEFRAFRSLEYIKTPHHVLKNVELSDGDIRTEIDALVITERGIIIVEVKNTGKDIFIDEKGDYYRTGEFLKWDCNLAEKMAVKETLLRKVLADAGMEIPTIQGVVVFTDNRIQVQNKYDQIETCFVSQLSYKIDGFKSDTVVSTEKMELIKETVEQAAAKEIYPFEFDVAGFKKDFAVLMAILEDAAVTQDYKEESEIIDFPTTDSVVIAGNKPCKPKSFAQRKIQRIGNVAAIAAVSLMAGYAVVNTFTRGI